MICLFLTRPETGRGRNEGGGPARGFIVAPGTPTITIRDVSGDSQRITTFPLVQVHLQLIIADPFFAGRVR